MTDETPDAPETGEPQLPDALLRALRAPGTPEELAGESDILAAFRAARPASAPPASAPPASAPRLRLVRRVGAGGAAVVATVVLGSGVAAAAYTNSLPEPVQQLAHRVLAPIGVPAAAPRPHRPKPTLPSAPTTSARPTGEPTRTRSNKPSHAPTRTSTPSPAAPTLTGSSSPSATPTAAATPTPAPTPTASATAAPSSTSSPTAQPSPTGSPTAQPSKPARPVPAAISLTLSANRVVAGSTVLATAAAVDASGKPVAKQRVALQATTGTGWATVASGVTDRLGTVSLYSPAVTQNTRFRLKVTGPGLSKALLSDAARVTETPELIATFESGTIRISAVGAQPGDTVRIGLVQNGVLTPAGTATISAGSATFPVGQATTKQRYVVVLPRTPRHAAGRTSVVVPRLTGR